MHDYSLFVHTKNVTARLRNKRTVIHMMRLHDEVDFIEVSSEGAVGTRNQIKSP